jgi:hypothetical protein
MECHCATRTRLSTKYHDLIEFPDMVLVLIHVFSSKETIKLIDVYIMQIRTPMYFVFLSATQWLLR